MLRSDHDGPRAIGQGHGGLHHLVGEGAGVILQMGIQNGEQLRGVDAVLDALGQGSVDRHLLAQGGVGQGQHHQIGGGNQGFPVAGGAEARPAHHGAGVKTLQGGHPLGQARGHHHRTGGALQQKEHLGRRLLQPADRLAEGEAQQLPLAGETLENIRRLVGQERKGAQQLKQLAWICHGSALLGRGRHQQAGIDRLQARIQRGLKILG